MKNKIKKWFNNFLWSANTHPAGTIYQETCKEFRNMDIYGVEKMTENKRYELCDEGFGIIDNLTKRKCHTLNCILKNWLNSNWEQTKRFEKHNQFLEKTNGELETELLETKEILRSVEKDRNQTLLICKKYEGFFKEKGFDIKDLLDYARDGSND